MAFDLLFLLISIPTFVNQTNYAKITWGLWQQNSPYRKKFWYLSDLIQSGYSVKEIKIFQVASRFLSELQDIYNKFVKDNTKVARKQFRTNVALNLFGVAIYIGIEIFIILSAIARKISIGDISYFTTVLSSFQNAVNGLFEMVPHYLRLVYMLMRCLSYWIQNPKLYNQTKELK